MSGRRSSRSVGTSPGAVLAPSTRRSRPLLLQRLSVGTVATLAGLAACCHPTERLFASWGVLKTQARLDQRQLQGRTARHAVMEPPVIEAPPDLTDQATGGASPWAECIVEECLDEACSYLESWVLRGEHVRRFSTFLEHRGFQPAERPTFLEDPNPVATYKQVQMKSTKGTTATCRERRVDPSLSCAECARLILGGPYGARGVVVGAYPPQAGVTGCLALSRELPDPLNKEAKSTPDSTGSWDSSKKPQEVAFCNTVRAQFPV